MTKNKKAVVLLSGGMDSAVALYWAMENLDPITTLFFDYNQLGVNFEKDRSRKLSLLCGLPMQISRIAYPSSIRSTIIEGSGTPIRDVEHHRRRVPMSFVPGRNLTMISVAAAVAYEEGAAWIVGGWNSVDVDYPDCTHSFLVDAGTAVCEALGLPYTEMIVTSPIIDMNKTQIVQLGEELDVPWGFTRSCYGKKYIPCLQCDSCVKRMNAFLEAGVRDPIVSNRMWSKIVEQRKDSDE